METIVRDYQPRGVQFLYIYKSLAHPETNGYITPYTLQERLMHVREAERRLGSHATWICDSMENELKHALGDAPNSEFVIDPDGKVVRKRVWSRPAELRKDLETLIGPVDRATAVAELDMPSLTPPQKAATGVVPRVSLPGPLRPVIVKPTVQQEGPPFFVKLRAEAQESLLREGAGKLYLGFYPDPLYQVHWNNRAEPLRFEIETPDSANVSPRAGRGPKVDVDADADPREFLVDVALADRSAASEPVTLNLTVHYFACDDAETFCVPVKQHYEILLQADPDGGNRRPPSRRDAPGNPAAPGGLGGRPGPAGMGPAQRMRRLMQLDADGDGQIRRGEAPPAVRRMFDVIDTNGDGFLQRGEIEARFFDRGPPSN